MANIVDKSGNNSEKAPKASYQVGFWSAILTAVITAVTFGFAITAIPVSGANCLENCVAYPYLNTIAQFPKDYRWMVLALFMVLSYLVLMVAIHALAPLQKKVFGQVGLTFATIAALVLLADYFLQFSVVPISLMSGETEGITLLTQYNAHGIFIVLEELGYIMMAFSFLFAALALARESRQEKAAWWVFVVGFVLALVSLVIFAALFGLDRQDRYEVLVISITWLVLIINGILLGLAYKKKLNTAG